MTTNFAHGSDEAMRAILQIDGRLVAIGYSTGVYSGTDFAAVRYMPDGSLDPSFGDGGKLWTDFTNGVVSNEVGYAAAIQADGKVVVGGVKGSFTGMIRYQPSSTLIVTVAPTPPTDLTVGPVTGTTVTLYWSNTSQVQTGFIAEASTDGVTFTTVGTAGPDATQMTVTSLSPATTYTFRVRATNGTTIGAASGVTADATTTGSGELSATGIPVTATEGLSFTSVVAHFTDSEPQTESDYTVVVHWGDGVNDQTAQVVVSSGGGFDVIGTHTYHESGSYTVGIDVTGIGTPTPPTASAGAAATVGDADLHATMMDLAFTEGFVFQGTVATFYDDNPYATADEFTATIDWDGGVGVEGALVLPAGKGLFRVVGMHVYHRDNPVTIAVTIHDSDGAEASASRAAVVAPCAVDIHGDSISGLIEGTSYSGEVAWFTLGDPLSEDEYTLKQITWMGDGGGTEEATIAPIPGTDRFSVSSSGHMFKEEGAEMFNVMLTHGRNTVFATGTARIADAALNQLASGGTITVDGDDESGWDINNEVVASFGDDDPFGETNDYNAIIHWRDGSTSAGTINPDVDEDGNPISHWTVVGSHHYNTRFKTCATYWVELQDAGVTLAIVNGSIEMHDTNEDDTTDLSGKPALEDREPQGPPWDRTAPPSGGLSSGTPPSGTEPEEPPPVTDGNLMVTSERVYGVEGHPLVPGQRVAIIADDPLLDAAEYNVDVILGGEAVPVTLQPGDSGYDVFIDSGGPDLDEEGYQTLTITVSGGGRTVTTPGNVVVNDAELTAGSSNGTLPTENGVFNQKKLISFTDDNPHAPKEDFRATIEWGDGETSDGIIYGSDGDFWVEGMHAYDPDDAEVHTVAVWVYDDGGSQTAGAVTIDSDPMNSDVSLTVRDDSISAGGHQNSVTVSDDGSTELYVREYEPSLHAFLGVSASGSAGIDLSQYAYRFTPVQYVSQQEASGYFGSGEAHMTIAPDGDRRDFQVEMGLESNDTTGLQDEEVQRTVNVHAVKVKDLSVYDDNSDEQITVAAVGGSGNLNIDGDPAGTAQITIDPTILAGASGAWGHVRYLITAAAGSVMVNGVTDGAADGDFSEGVAATLTCGSSKDFTIKVGFDTNNDHQLTQDEVDRTVYVHVFPAIPPVETPSLTVSDTQHQTNSISVTTPTEGNLYVRQVNGSATVWIATGFGEGVANVRWQVSGGGQADQSGTEDDSVTLTPTSNQQVYTIVAGIDSDGSGTLEGNEIIRTINVTLLRLDTLKVEDNAHAENFATTDGDLTGNAIPTLYIGAHEGTVVGAPQYADVKLSVFGDPTGLTEAGRRVLWSVTPGSLTNQPAPDQRNFINPHPVVRLTASTGNEGFVLNVGIDANGNFKLDPGEITHVVYMQLLHIEALIVQDRTDITTKIIVPPVLPALPTPSTFDVNPRAVPGSPGKIHTEIYLDLVGGPDTLAGATRAVWEVTGNTTSQWTGTFVAGGVPANPTIDLMPNDASILADRTFGVKVGFDDNLDGDIRDPGETRQEVTVHVRDLKEYAHHLIDVEEQKHIGHPYYIPTGLPGFFATLHSTVNQISVQFNDNLPGTTSAKYKNSSSTLQLRSGASPMDAVHESVHALDDMNDWTDLNVNLRNAEALAHGAEFVLQQLPFLQAMESTPATKAQSKWNSAWAQINSIIKYSPFPYEYVGGSGTSTLETIDIQLLRERTGINVSASVLMPIYNELLQERGVPPVSNQLLPIPLDAAFE